MKKKHQLIIMLLVTLTFTLTNGIVDSSANTEVKIHEVYVFSEAYAGLLAGFYPEGTILNLSLYVLPCSNSTVFFFYNSHNTWSPEPQNYTLTPGEKTTETTHTLIEGRDEGQSGAIDYFAIALEDNSNATVQLIHYVIKLGKTPGFDFITSFGSIISVIIITSIIKQRKNEVKKKIKKW